MRRAGMRAARQAVTSRGAPSRAALSGSMGGVEGRAALWTAARGAMAAERYV